MQRKLDRLAAAAATAALGGSGGAAQAAAGEAVAGWTAEQLASLQQLFAAVGGLRLRRVFWAVVQGRLPARQTGMLKNRCAC